MGLYLEHRHPAEGGTKLDWLLVNGAEVAGITPHSPNVDSDERVLVAYTRNPFEAAALMWAQREVKRYVLGRPDARWFRVPLSTLTAQEQSYISPVRR
jgi:hypothetical protein